MKIDYIRHHEINKNAYDQCVENSLQGTVYAMSWYLDTVSPGWDVLVAGDYESVMPLPVKRRYGINYASQPPLCQQLGIFSSKPVTKEVFDLFIAGIPYADYDLRFNSGNIFESQEGNVGQNHLLDLSKPYEEIKSKYKSNCLRNIQKAKAENLAFCDVTSPQEYLKILAVHATLRPVLKMIPLLEVLLQSSGKNAHVEIWNVHDSSQEILSCAFFLYWKNRIYYMMPVTTLDGRKTQSMSLLIDALIRSRSSANYILDFEGSSIPGVARFYEGFGAKFEIYPHVVKKSLPAKVYRAIKRMVSR